MIEPPGRVTSQEILVAALGCITHTGTLTVGGTQRGAETMFYQIVSGELETKMANDPMFAGFPKQNWVIGRFPWWSSPALCNDVPRALREAPAMDTFARVERFGNTRLKNQFTFYYTTHGLEIFQREFEMLVLDDKESYFDLDLIRSCYPQNGYPYWFMAPQKQIEGKDYAQNGSAAFREAFRMIDALGREIRNRNLRGQWGFSMDIGRDNDQDEIWIAQVPFEDSQMLYPRLNIGMNKMDWNGKQEMVDYIMANLPITRGYFDGTKGSIGRQLSETNHRKYGQKAMPFFFTNLSKVEITSSLRGRMERGKIVLPPKTPRYEKLEQQLLKIKKIVSSSGNVIFDADRTKGDHADAAFSLMMMSELWETAATWAPRRGIATQRKAIALPQHTPR